MKWYLLVIDGYSNFVSAIDLKDQPHQIALNDQTNTIYVLKLYSGYLSIIDGETNVEIATISVGRYPKDIAVNPKTNTIYVTNDRDNTVSVIDGNTNQLKLIGQTTFDINPPNSGRVVCKNDTVPINKNLNLPFGVNCIAEPTKGFQFLNWLENLEVNSTRTINSSNSDSFWLFIWDTLGIKNVEESSILTVTNVGKFTANFARISPPIPFEYLIVIYTIAASVFTGWLVPNLSKTIKSSMQGRKTFAFLEQIRKNEYKSWDDVDQSISEIQYAYAKGKISRDQYDILLDKLEKIRNTFK